MSVSYERDFKQCPQCERILPLTDFHSNQRRPDGRAFYCKRCAASRSEQSRRRRGIGAQRRPAVDVPPGMKWCPDCDTVKPMAEFPRARARGNGIHTYCKPCHNARGVETKQRLYGGNRVSLAAAVWDRGEGVSGAPRSAGRGLRDLWRGRPGTRRPRSPAPVGCAGYCASTATAGSASSGITSGT